MASATAKKLCTKCNKSGGVATCYGCQEFLCNKHFIEHRQELGMQMDEVGQEHDLVQHDLTRENDAHPLLSSIDKWERESIVKIQATAESARVNLRQSIDRQKSELETSIGKMTEELQFSRESDDYTEIDLKRWIAQLNQIRKRLETSLIVEIINDERTTSSIRLIKMKCQQQTFPSACANVLSKEIISALQQPIQQSLERFDPVAEEVTLSEEGLVATCSRHHGWISSLISGTNNYSSGTHHIHLLIEQKGYYKLFFGIMTTLERLTKRGFPRSAYGWRDLDDPVINGQDQDTKEEKTIEVNDQVTLILDCDNQRIQLQHNRSNRLVNLAVDLRTCPFPWKVLVKFNSQCDRVRIVS